GSARHSPVRRAARADLAGVARPSQPFAARREAAVSHVVDRVSATPGVDVVIKPLKRDEDPSGWETRRRWRGRAFATAGPLLILCLWQLASSSGWIDERTFSSPAQVYFATIEMAQSGALLEHLGATGSRISLGYVVGAAFGVVL